MTDTTRDTVERTLRLAVTNRHITPAIEALTLAILAERDEMQADVAWLRDGVRDIAERIHRNGPVGTTAQTVAKSIQEPTPLPQTNATAPK
jgi:hypothetical protein